MNGTAGYNMIFICGALPDQLGFSHRVDEIRELTLRRCLLSRRAVSALT
jgi:hypothetical protein